MDFMTIKQTSEKWGICIRRVQTLCTEGRIEGAERLGHQWLIPITAEKPQNAGNTMRRSAIWHFPTSSLTSMTA